MADKKTNTKEKTVKENIYVIPLREKCRPVPRYKKTNKAVKTIKEFIVRHMKIRDRDLRKVKIDSYLNDALWSRGIKNPPHKIKVKAYADGESVRVELVDMPKKLKDKQAREEKMLKVGEEAGMKKKKVKAEKEEKPEEKTEEQKEEFEEKKASVVEAGKEMEKEMAKQAKHASKKQAVLPTASKKSLQR